MAHAPEAPNATHEILYIIARNSQPSVRGYQRKAFLPPHSSCGHGRKERIFKL